MFQYLTFVHSFVTTKTKRTKTKTELNQIGHNQILDLETRLRKQTYFRPSLLALHPNCVDRKYVCANSQWQKLLTSIKVEFIPRFSRENRGTAPTKTEIFFVPVYLTILTGDLFQWARVSVMMIEELIDREPNMDFGPKIGECERPHQKMSLSVNSKTALRTYPGHLTLVKLPYSGEFDPK